MLDLVAEADGRGLAACKGYRNTAVFLAAAMRLSPREAKARVAHATTPMPLTGKALGDGAITVEHVSLIHHVLSQAPDDLDAELREYAEKTLVDLARQAPPLSVRHAGERLLAYWDVDSKKPKDPLAEPKRRLTWRFDKAGQMHINSGWSMRIANGVPEFIPPKWLDQKQKPIRNTTHNLPHEHAA